MVGFEAPSSKFAAFKALPPSRRRAKILKLAIGGAAGVAVVAGAGVAIAFGSIAATAANEAVIAFGAGGGGGGGLGGELDDEDVMWG